jgi:hypothetical protein
MAQARDAQWEQSEKSFRHALELEPSRALTRADFALSVLLPLGRIDEAVAQVRLAEQNDRLSPSVEFVLAYTLFFACRIDEALLIALSRARALSFSRVRLMRPFRFLKIASRIISKAADAGDLGYAYALAGRRGDAERIAALQPRPIPRAQIFVGLGEKDRAF